MSSLLILGPQLCGDGGGKKAKKSKEMHSSLSRAFCEDVQVFAVRGRRAPAWMTSLDSGGVPSDVV